MPSVVRAPFGPAATAALRAVVARAKQHDPLAPVTVAVPSNYAGLSLRRQLGSAAPGVVNVRFLSLDRVAELLGASLMAAAGRRPLSPAVRAEAIRAALVDGGGVLAASAGHPATLRALDRTRADLRECTEDALDRVAAQSPRAAEIVALTRDVRERLRRGWYDEHDLAVAAAAAIRAESPALADLGHLVVFCPRRLSPSLAAMVDALGHEATVIEGDAVDADGRAPVADRIITATDPDEEVRAAVRELAARAQAGAPLHRMALLYPSAEPYARIAHQQLRAAALPYNGPAVQPLAATVAGRTLVGMLALPEHDWRRDDVMAWLAAAPVVEGPGGQVVPAVRWDKLSREAGVVAGVHQWHQRLAAAVARLGEQQRQAAGSDEEPDWRAQRLALDVERAERLRAFVIDLIAAVEVPGMSTWREHSSWACRLLDRYLGGVSRHGSWPVEEQDAFTAVRQVLERLGGLDEVGAPVEGATFRRAVEQELGVASGRVGRFGDGVFVAPVAAALATDFDTVIVVGLAEGTLPSQLRDDALLPDRERVVAGGALAARAERQADEHRDYLAALAAGRERIITWPRSDLRRGRTRLPSRFLLDTAAALAGEPALFLDGLEALMRTDARVADVASFEAGVRGAAEPASLTEYDVARLLDWTAAGGRPTDHFLAREQPRWATGVAAATARAGRQFTRFDGRVGPGAVAAPTGDDVLSPTSLESYATCPMRYLLARVLRVGAVERPEEVMRVSARDKGTLVHAILEDYVRTVVAGEAKSRERLLAIAARHCAAFEQLGLAGKPLAWRYDRSVIMRELVRFFEDDTNTPVAAELAFGVDDVPPVSVTLPDGRTVRFRGFADRVDVADDGSLIVTDYKTGGRYSYEALKDDVVDAGRKLQLPLYGLAAQAQFGGEARVYSRYWFVSEKGDFRERGYDVDDDVLTRLHDVLGVIIDGIAAGSFPARPGEPRRDSFDNCTYCDYDVLCHRDRAHHWERKRDAPELREYVALAEPRLAVEPA